MEREYEMMKNIFQGKLVSLVAEDPQVVANAYAHWNRNAEFKRLLDADPAMLWSAKKIKEWLEKEIEDSEPKFFSFQIRDLQSGKMIGFTGLGDLEWNHGDGWVGIGIGESEYWGKGYGTEAMQLTLRYAFTELNLHRVTLGVFDYNPRAIRSYEKVGFKLEGRLRGEMSRQGKRHDILIMGILRSEWEIG
jgi:RimJ/RimL family protein N-acetyltransferase